MKSPQQDGLPGVTEGIPVVSNSVDIETIISESISRISIESGEAGLMLSSAAAEMRRMRAEIAILKGEKRMLSKRVSSAYIVLYDHDGYYDPVKKTGNAEGLAAIIDDALLILSGSEDESS